MPFAPPSPDTLVEEPVRQRFVPPSPNAFVDETSHDTEHSEEADAGRQPPEHGAVMGKRQVAEQSAADEAAISQPIKRNASLVVTDPNRISPVESLPFGAAAARKPLDIVDSGIWNKGALDLPMHTTPGQGVTGKIHHALDDLVAGVFNYATSPQGLVEGAVAQTPAAPLVLAKWARDMYLGAKHSAVEFKQEIAQMVNESFTRKFLAMNQMGVPPLDPQVMEQHKQNLINDLAQAGMMGLGAAGAGVHAGKAALGAAVPLAKAGLAGLESVQAGREMKSDLAFDVENEAIKGGLAKVAQVAPLTAEALKQQIIPAKDLESKLTPAAETTETSTTTSQPPENVQAASTPAETPAETPAPVVPADEAPTAPAPPTIPPHAPTPAPVVDPVRAVAPVDLRPAGEAVAEVEKEKAPVEPEVKPIPKSIPFGRLNDLRSRADADLIAYKPGVGSLDDFVLKRYASRAALESFLKNPGAWHALVKTPTERNSLIHPAFQSERQAGGLDAGKLKLLREEGLTQSQAEDLLSGKLSIKDAVEATMADFKEKLGSEVVHDELGTLSHDEAIQQAHEMGVDRINEILGIKPNPTAAPAVDTKPSQPTDAPPEQSGQADPATAGDAVFWTVTQDGEMHGFFKNKRQADMVASGLSGKVEVKAQDFGALNREPAPSTTSIDPSHTPSVEVPLSEIALSEDVPNFKGDANPATGVVAGQELEGSYVRLGNAPIVLWRRNNGKLEVITGRHRLDLARRSGEPTIPAHIVEEAKGFTQAMALTFDAEANIRDGQGSVEDFAHYFKNTPGLDEIEARSRGLLSRAKGKAGWDLAHAASDDLYALWKSGKVNEAQAIAIARAAPGNASAQQIGSKYALQGRPPDFIANLIKAALSESQGKAENLDLFGADDSAMQAMAKQAERAASIQAELTAQIRAVKPAAKNPEVARKMGVDVNDPAAVLERVSALKAELERWENWPLHPDLVARTKGIEILPKAAAPKLRPGEKGTGDLLQGGDAPFNLAGEAGVDAQRIAAEKAKAEQVKKEAQELADKQQMDLLAPKAKPVEPVKGAQAVAQRIVNAEESFIQFAMNTAGLTREQAVAALERYRADKVIKIDPVGGQYTLKHGAFAEAEVLRKAAGIESVAKPFPPALAARLLSLSREQQTSGYGPANETLRQDILEAITGTRPTKSKSGARAVETALAKHFGIDETTMARVGVDEAVREKLQEVVAGKDKPILPRENAEGAKAGALDALVAEHEADQGGYQSPDKHKLRVKIGYAIEPGLRMGDAETVGATYVLYKKGEATLAEFNKVLAQHQRQLGLPERSLDQAVASPGGGIDSGKLGPLGMGGAKPGEFAQPGSVVSNMFAAIDADRAAMGKPPMPETKARTWDQDNTVALNRMNRDPQWIPDLIAEVTKTPRPLLSWENAGLVWQRAKWRAEANNALTRIARAFEDGRAEDLAEARLDAARFEDHLEALDKAVGRNGTGSEAGRTLQAQKMASGEDYSLIEMRLRKRESANGGGRLSPEQEAEIQRLHDQIAATQKAFDDHVAAADQRVAELDRVIQEAKAAPRVHPRILEVAENIVKRMENAADAATTRLKAKLARTSAGVDPTILSDLVIIGSAKMARGIVELGKWSEAMIAHLGEEVKPFLEEAHAATQKAFDEAVERMAGKRMAPQVARVLKGADVAERITNATEKIGAKVNGGEANEIHPFVKRLVRAMVEQNPAIEREALVDQVHEILKGVLPEMTRIEAMDAISGRGQFWLPSQDAVSKTVRDLSTQIRLVAHQMDVLDRKPLPRTGFQPEPLSDAARREQQRLNDLKRQYGVTVTDPATQLASVLSARKTYYTHRLADLRAEIASRERIVKSKSPSPTDAALESLKAEYQAVKAEHETIFKPGLTDEQRVKLALAAAQRTESAWQTRLERAKRGDFGTDKAESKTPSNAALDAIRARTEALRQEVKELQDIANPKKTPEQIALQSLKTRLANRTAELLAKTATGDFSPPAKGPPVKLDAEAQRLKAENAAAKLEFLRGLTKDRMAKRTTLEKAQDTLVKWRRGFLLSGPITLAKLTSAAVQRLGFSFIEEGAGGVISKALPGVAEHAPREGYFHSRAEARALVEGFTKGMADAWQTLKTGHSELDLLYGKPDVIPHSAIEFFGHLHGMLKAPTKRAEFTRSLEKRMAHAIINGIDVSDPLVQTRLAVEAYKDANRAIFMQDNRAVSFYKRALSALDQKDKATGKVPVSSKAAATALRVALPIVKIPTNIAAETMQYATGLITGSARLAKAFRNGLDTLPPEQADLILRELKKGSVGAAVMALGYLNPNFFGGYYQPGQKRDPADVKAGSMRVPGVALPKWLGGPDLPSFLLHNPLLETAQLGATVRRVADSKLRKKDTEPQGLGAGLMAGALGVAEEVPFVNEMFQLAKIQDPSRRGTFAGEYTKSVVVPQAVQWVARQTDKNEQGEVIQRKPRNLVEHIETGIPGLRQKVPAK